MGRAAACGAVRWFAVLRFQLMKNGAGGWASPVPRPIAPIEPLLYRRPIPPLSPGRLLLGKAGIARMVEHVDRRIGKLLRHSKAADKFSVGHEQRRLGEHVTNCGALLADWLVLVQFHSPKESPGPKPRALVCHRLSRRAWAINLARVGCRRERQPRCAYPGSWEAIEDARRDGRRDRGDGRAGDNGEKITTGLIPRWEHCSFECPDGAHWFGLSQPCPVADEAAGG
jgi:hypothetical protein